MGTKISSEKKEHAYLLYMLNTPIGDILKRTGIKSNSTINRWIKEGDWKEKRAAKTISRTELINKTLKKINELLDNPEEFSADQLSKLASLVEKLDKQDSPVVIIDVLMAFGKWLQRQATIDKRITLDFMKLLNSLQDEYISHKLSE